MAPATVNTDRDTAIFHAYLAGETLASIGLKYGITRERVRQVLDQQGVNRRKKSEAARVRNERLIALHGDSIIAEYKRLGTINDTLLAFSGIVPATVVREVLSTTARVYKRRNGRKTYTEEAILIGLRRADLVGASTCARYQKWRELEGEDVASVPLIVMRFGSWNNARRAAGLDVVRDTVGAGRRQEFTESEILEAVKRFVTACQFTGTHPSARAYDEWAHAVGDIPSMSTVRVRLNMAWLDIVEMAGGAA